MGLVVYFIWLANEWFLYYVQKLLFHFKLASIWGQRAEICAVRRSGISLATGLRQANVTGLQWPQIDLPRRLAWIHPDQAKARRAIPVPLNAEAYAVISKQLGKHSTHVFSFKGNPITQVSTKAWYAALERASIEDFRWHDLRHTWASWHVQNGTPLFALQELGGWESVEMVRHYAHLAADHLSPYADRLITLRD